MEEKFIKFNIVLSLENKNTEEWWRLLEEVLCPEDCAAESGGHCNIEFMSSTTGTIEQLYPEDK